MADFCTRMKPGASRIRSKIPNRYAANFGIMLSTKLLVLANSTRVREPLVIKKMFTSETSNNLQSERVLKCLSKRLGHSCISASVASHSKVAIF
jgi:hypothetical protein